MQDKASLLSTLPTNEDLFLKLAKLEAHLELLALQEDYIKDESRNLKRELLRAQEEVKRIQSVPLVIGQFLEPIDTTTAIVGSTTGSNYVVRILSTIDRELLKPSSSVALHRHSNALVDVLPPEADSSISMLGADERPDVCVVVVSHLFPAVVPRLPRVARHTVAPETQQQILGHWRDGHPEAGDPRGGRAPAHPV